MFVYVCLCLSCKLANLFLPVLFCNTIDRSRISYVRQAIYRFGVPATAKVTNECAFTALQAVWGKKPRNMLSKTPMKRAHSAPQLSQLSNRAYKYYNRKLIGIDWKNYMNGKINHASWLNIKRQLFQRTQSCSVEPPTCLEAILYIIIIMALSQGFFRL